MENLLEKQALITHGTYTLAQIEELEDLKARALQEHGIAFLNFSDRLKLFNYLYLTGTFSDQYLSFDPTDWFRQCADDAFMEVLQAAGDGESNRYQSLVGYKYAQGTVRPLDIGDEFSINPDHSLVDVGCGFAQGSIEAADQSRSPVYLVDPNVFNIRAVYEQLARKKLLGNSRVQVRLALVQDAGLPAASFDRAYLGNTTYFMGIEETRAVLQSVLPLLKGGGVAAIIPPVKDSEMEGFSEGFTWRNAVYRAVSTTLICVDRPFAIK